MSRRFRFVRMTRRVTLEIESLARDQTMIRKIMETLFGRAESSADESFDTPPTEAPRNVERLLDELQHRDWLRRRRAAVELGEFEREARPALVALVEALVDVRDEVRHAADRALARIDPAWRTRPQIADAVPTLVRALAGDRAPDVARAAGETLDRLGVVAGPGLARFVREDDNLYLQILAIRALGKLGPGAAPAVTTLISTLKAQPHALREAAAQALERIGPAASAALEPLRVLTKDPYSAVSQAATAALAKIEPPKPT
jgi:HEAT repeat protein